MATDLDAVVSNLRAFRDLADCTVVSVGAGGGQLVEYGRHAGHVVAIDSDRDALDRLSRALAAKDLSSKYELVCQDFTAADGRALPSGDVVLFEFSLHEMDDPEAALQRSRSLAPETVVIDHSPGSKWAWYVGEDAKVQRAWSAIASLRPRSCAHHDTFQFFASYEDLCERVRPQGQVALERVKELGGTREIVIPMRYGLALL